MSTQENKTNIRRLLEGLNTGNFTGINELVSPNYVDHSLPPGTPTGRDGFKAFVTGMRAAFPDLHYEINDEIVEGDKLVHRVTANGTMQGAFQGMPATGKHGTWTEMHIARFEGGKMVEHWANVDQMGMLVSLGVMPAAGK